MLTQAMQSDGSRYVLRYSGWEYTVSGGVNFNSLLIYNTMRIWWAVTIAGSTLISNFHVLLLILEIAASLLPYSVKMIYFGYKIFLDQQNLKSTEIQNAK